MIRLSTFVLMVFFTGCGVFNLFEGSFSQEDWEIEKIIVHDKEFFALRNMREMALQALQNNQNDIQDTSKEHDEEATAQEKQELLQNLEELAQIQEISILKFDTQENKIFGLAGCNNFSADYSWKDADNIEIYEINITRKLCNPPAIMDFELTFITNLKGVFFVEKKNKEMMILKNQDVQIFLKSQ